MCRGTQIKHHKQETIFALEAILITLVTVLLMMTMTMRKITTSAHRNGRENSNDDAYSHLTHRIKQKGGNTTSQQKDAPKKWA